jgi:60 kDa SS-A/Ro ribonucleoprotein
VDKTLLQPQTTKNKAGGNAYELSKKEALAQYAATGFFGSTYYTDASEQLDEVKKLCEGLDNEFIARCAVYARQQGKLKDMPAYLLAVLASRYEPNKPNPWFGRAFPHVIDNGKMLRNFVQIVRSGVTGRKSFGHQPRRLIEGWLNSRHPMSLLRDSIGEDPSLAYIIRTIRPALGDNARHSLFGYLLGKETVLAKPRKPSQAHSPKSPRNIDRAVIAAIVERQQQRGLPYVLDEEAGTVLCTKYDSNLLPDAIKQYEHFKKTREGAVPDVDFRMLDSLGLDDDEWSEVAARASWTMTIKNLNTFKRHGVFARPALIELIAERLSNKELVQKAKVFPYQILSAYRAISEAPPTPSWRFTSPQAVVDMPSLIVDALGVALDHALENVPYLDGDVAICLDVSGSMSSPVTGVRKGQTTKVRCIDAAALFAAAFHKRSKRALILPFDTKCYEAQIGKEATTLNLATRLAAFGGGGTNCELPLAEMNKRGLKPDIVVYVSDNESWAGNYYGHETGMLAKWKKLKARSPKSKLVCIDIAAGTSAQVTSTPDRLNIGGFSDSVFTVVADFLSGATKNWVGVIEATEL